MKMKLLTVAVCLSDFQQRIAVAPEPQPEPAFNRCARLRDATGKLIAALSQPTDLPFISSMTRGISVILASSAAWVLKSRKAMYSCPFRLLKESGG